MSDHLDVRIFETEAKNIGEYVKAGHAAVQQLGLELAEMDIFLGTNERTKYSEGMKDAVKDLLEVEYDVRDNVEALKKSSRKIKSCLKESEEEAADSDLLSAQIPSGDELFHQMLATVRETSTRDVEAADKFKAMVTLMGKGADKGQEDEDEDLQTMESTPQNIPKDPFTQKEVEDPVKNKQCGHVYDRSAFMLYITQATKARCPHLGCGNRNVMTCEDIEADVVTRALIQRIRCQKRR